MLRDPASPYLPVALLDDDPAKRKLRIMGVPVVGGRYELAAAAEDHQATAVLIAIPSADTAMIGELTDLAAEAGVSVKVLPAVRELIGGDVVITMPSSWQKRFNASSIEVKPRMDNPVDPAVVAELSANYPDFVRAYEPDGLRRDEFDAFPPTARTIRAFIASYHELLHQVTDAMIPNPDARPA